MSKILDAQDILTEARDFIECIGMAAAASILAREFGAPIVAVANAASQKIDEAVELLAECGRANNGPVPAAPDAKPKSPAARTKGRST
jgi:hypothetical protein